MTTSGGTVDAVPLFTGTAAVGNSVITQSGGNVGIGTAAPTALLEVNGSAKVDGNIIKSATDISNIVTEGWSANVFYFNGAQEGTIYPVGPASPVTLWPDNSLVVEGDGTGGLVLDTYGSGPILIGSNRSFAMAINNGGNVGIGTTAPGAKLELNGNLKLTAGSGASITFADGTTQTTAFLPANCGADYAESVGVGGDRTSYGPGDLLVIDPDAPGKFLKSDEAYSTLVAGIYSTQPGFVGRLRPRDAETDKTEVPMAMVGRVPTKASAENGPIKVGDLLVASATPGYAMKGTDRGRMLGAVVGKALAPLDSGTGVILVLVTLQ